MYKLTLNTDLVIRLRDNIPIPRDPGNKDWREYQMWLSRGGDPLPVTEEEKEQARIADLIKQKLESIREEVRTTFPPQSVPELSNRVKKLEILMGIKEPEITE